MTSNWTSANIPDLTDKVIIVTGGNSGIGFEAAKEVAHNGAKTILACRDINKAEAAKSQIKSEIVDALVETMTLDLSKQASVHQFASNFREKYNRLDVLVNNAGIMSVPYSITEDGFESQFATNHLGHFALTGLLLDVILKTPGSRVVNVSSGGHRMGNVDFDNLMYEGGLHYSPYRAYGRSKLANLLFTYELQRYFESLDADAIAVAAHPGSSMTNLGRHVKDRWYFRLLMLLAERLSQSAAMGALPTIRAAVDPNVKGGEYYGPGGLMGQRGYPILVQSSKASHNKADACQLWQVSKQLTGVRYTQI